MRHWISLVADVTCVITFVAVGRATHDENLGLLGVLGTAWPFLVGAIAAHLVVLLRRRDPSSLPTGLLVWTSTLVAGMLLRAVTGAGVQVSFVITTALVLAVLMLVWRGVHRLVRPGGRRPADGPAVPTVQQYRHLGA